MSTIVNPTSPAWSIDRPNLGFKILESNDGRTSGNAPVREKTASTEDPLIGAAGSSGLNHEANVLQSSEEADLFVFDQSNRQARALNIVQGFNLQDDSIHILGTNDSSSASFDDGVLSVDGTAVADFGRQNATLGDLDIQFDLA